MKPIAHIDRNPVYQYTIIEPYLQLIKSGKKKVEGRVNSIGYKVLNEGVFISFITKREEVLCKVLYKRVYSDFGEMIVGEGLERLLPNVKTVEQGIRIYNRFPRAERVRQYGALAIGIETISWRYRNTEIWYPFAQRKEEPEVKKLIQKRALEEPSDEERELKYKRIP